MPREKRVARGKTGNEMVFEGADGSFGGISSMDMRGHQLIFDVIFGKVLAESLRGLVVQDVKTRLQATASELRVHAVEGRKKGGPRSVFQGFR